MEVRIDLANIKDVKVVTEPIHVDRAEIKGKSLSDPLEQRMHEVFFFSQDCRKVVESISAVQKSAQRVGPGSTLIIEVSDS